MYKISQVSSLAHARVTLLIPLTRQSGVNGPQQEVVFHFLCSQGRDGRFGSKVGQIGPKWNKSGAFSDQISVHLAPPRQMH